MLGSQMYFHKKTDNIGEKYLGYKTCLLFLVDMSVSRNF